MPGFASRGGDKGPANAGFSGTEVQPLSASLDHPSAKGALGNEVSIDDEWEEALKNLPLASKSIGVDIDISIFPDAAAAPDAPATSKPLPAPSGAPSVGKQGNVLPPSNIDNGIDFDIAPDIQPSPAKNPNR
jgi:hypothetical protein